MTFPFFKNRKSRRELEAEIDAAHHEIDLAQAIAHAHEARVKELESQPNPLAKIELIPSLNLTLAKWLREENLIASAATILKHPDMRAMLDVLKNEHPAIKGIALGTAIDQRAIFQARGEGYQLCLNNLMALGEKPKKKTEIEETFAEENVGGKK